MNYKKLGLKCGLEVHEQLDTKHKLFCNCSTAMQQKEPMQLVKRKQHPVASELGQIDVAAQYEYLRDRNFIYHVFDKESCLVETDCEPPHELNPEALRIALEIALLLNCEVPNEIHVMRKTITDGSNTTAFQRTMVVGLNGYLRCKGKKIEIKHVSLEEDAAAIIDEKNGNISYKLNRLAVPLVEIATGLLVGFSPDDAQEIAFSIGMLCRSTGRVKRGIGTIRQDVNVSIAKGARTEIKGVQELGILSKVIENEVQRQLSLIEIKKELAKRGVRKLKAEAVDMTSLLRGTESKIIEKIISSGGSLFAIKLPGFDGLLKKEICAGKTFGRELADYAKSFGVDGILHSDDDLAKYNASMDFLKLREFLKAGDKDAIVVVGEFKDKGKVADELIKKCAQVLVGVKEETRSADSDATTRYTRPLPGAARLYPETDIRPIAVESSVLAQIKKELPESWTKKLSMFKKKLKLSDDIANQLIRSEYLGVFENIMKNKKIEPSVVASTFVNTLKDLRREGVRIDNLTEQNFAEIFDYLAKEKIAKEAIPEIIKYLASNPDKSISKIIEELKLTPISMEDLKNIVREVVAKPAIDMNKAIGIVMSKVRGRIEAKIVIETVKKMMKH